MAEKTYVALLRGINLGGRNRLPMRELAALFADCDCGAVRTYIQSGNVVFEASPKRAERVPACVAAAIEERFGFSSPVVLRSAEELRGVAGANPFLAEGADPGALHVAFLADAPSAARIGTLDDHRSPPDRFVVRGREIYLHLPQGMARTRLSNQYFDSRLATTSTIRNWRTVLKLVDMTSG
ncbi:MAG TPA: DUF1697 domain-containing protein [Thermoanaerobaculia bacterium]|nr:DUF1697 domain-containing protein [Thermoanaerobaculia bacterium]